MKAFYCLWKGLDYVGPGDVRVAATASKARYLYWLDLSDVWPMATLMECEVRRAANLDPRDSSNPTDKA